jgi:cytosine/adenosine deaminase-related metal-dependent hydrolase
MPQAPYPSHSERDIISLNSGDLFSQMRLGLAHARCFDNDFANRRGAMPRSLTFSAKDALRWATVHGAEACGLESIVGSLGPGKEPDLVVIGGADSIAFRPRADPVASVVFQTRASDVRDVLIAGKLVKESGKLAGVDVVATLDGAATSAEAVLERVHKSTPELPPRSSMRLDAMETLWRSNLADARRPER